jgi:epoxide hydrolase-like predicted phosphatase
MTIKAVIFDFGGVLMRTGEPAGRREWETRLSLAPGQLEQIVHGSKEWLQTQQGLMAYGAYWQYVAYTLGISEAELPQLQSDYFRDDRLDQDLIKLLDDLRQKNYRVGLLSNDSVNLELKLRNELLIFTYFDAIVISAEIGIMKPDVRAYQEIANWLGVQPAECIFVDDVLENVEGARNAGMKAIHFKPPLDLRAEIQQLAAEA